MDKSILLVMPMSKMNTSWTIIIFILVMNECIHGSNTSRNHICFKVFGYDFSISVRELERRDTTSTE